MALHEFGHALALEHEQHHPGVHPWDREAVYQYFGTRITGAVIGWMRRYLHRWP